MTDTDAVGIYVNPLGIFAATNIGTGFKDGSSAYLASIYSANDGKGGIGGTADGFQFICRTMTGDGTLTANIETIDGNGNGNDQAGVHATPGGSPLVWCVPVRLFASAGDRRRQRGDPSHGTLTPITCRFGGGGPQCRDACCSS